MHCKLRAQASFTGHSNDIGPHAPVITVKLSFWMKFSLLVYLLGWLQRCARSDWSRIASYLTTIALSEMVTAKVNRGDY